VSLVDISDLLNISQSNWYKFSGDGFHGYNDWSGLFISNDRAFIATGASTLKTIDISTSTQPTQKANYNTHGRVVNFELDTNNAYVSTVNGQFHIIDISAPASPVAITTIGIENGFKGAMAISDNKAYITVDDKFQVIDISNPEQANIVGSLDTSFYSGPNAIGIHNNKAYLAGGPFHENANRISLQVIDITAPGSLQVLENISNPENDYYESATDIAIQNNAAYVIYAYSPGNEAITGKLQTIDISSSTPMTSSILTFTGGAQSVALSGNYAFVATVPGFNREHSSSGSLEVVDISNAHVTTPSVVSSMDLGYPGGNINITGNIASVLVSEDANFVYSTWTEGNTIFVDISNPLNPKKIVTMKNSGRSILKDNHVYSCSSGLSIVPFPVELTPVTINSTQSLTVDLPSEKQTPGTYILRTQNAAHEQDLYFTNLSHTTPYLTLPELIVPPSGSTIVVPFGIEANTETSGIEGLNIAFEYDAPMAYSPTVLMPGILSDSDYGLITANENNVFSLSIYAKTDNFVTLNGLLALVKFKSSGAPGD